MGDPLDEIFGARVKPFRDAKPPKIKYQKKPEDAFAESVAGLLRHILGPPGFTNANGVLWHATEARARRSVQEGQANMRRGCVSGCYDIDIYHYDRARKIELKVIYEAVSATDERNARGRQKTNRSQAQKVMGEQYDKARIPHGVAWTLPQVVALLDKFGVPHLITKF